MKMNIGLGRLSLKCQFIRTLHTARPHPNDEVRSGHDAVSCRHEERVAARDNMFGLLFWKKYLMLQKISAAIKQTTNDGYKRAETLL
jgi:uncharacterized protein with von Willebrand factor type A (vWA) domain